jgi:prephenate dehydratase/prolyl-tRNA editing enzyme YbaK/EbsC (Cys-tRNA(Pro) deacylase)
VLTPPIERTVSYLGPAGTHSHLVAISLFGPADHMGFRYQDKRDLSSVVLAVSSGEAGYGVIPYYNTISGPVKQVYPALLDFDHGQFYGLEVCGCVSTHISQDLLGLGLLEEIKTVYSKKEALEQCTHSLEQLLPGAKLSYCSSTAEAVCLAERNTPIAAAIASSRLLPFHKRLTLLKQGVQDEPINITRFLVVRRAVSCREGEITSDAEDTKQHTWLVFSSSLDDDILSKMLSTAQQWGISASALSGTVVDPIHFRMNFLLELNWPLDSLKVRFFLSEIAHLSPRIIGSPIIAGIDNLSGLQKLIFLKTKKMQNTLEEETIAARKYLDHDVLNILDKIYDYRLFIHPPVSSMESVWQVLGIEPQRMLNTQICYDSGVQEVAFCSVPGDKRVDIDKVSKYLSGNYRRANQSEIKQLGQTVGAVSPFTAPSNAKLLVDKRVNSKNLIFMGSGHIGISIALKLGVDKLPINIKVTDISEDE